jgi:hypothetical protein
MLFPSQLEKAITQGCAALKTEAAILVYADSLSSMSDDLSSLSYDCRVDPMRLQRGIKTP